MQPSNPVESTPIVQLMQPNEVGRRWASFHQHRLLRAKRPRVWHHSIDYESWQEQFHYVEILYMIQRGGACQPRSSTKAAAGMLLCPAYNSH